MYGRCYEYAGKFLDNHPDAVCVQGTYEVAPGWRSGHAWAELDGLCYDWQTHGRTSGGRSRFRITSTTPPGIPREQYHCSRAVVVHRTLTRDAVARAAVRHGYWGPWGEENDDV